MVPYCGLLRSSTRDFLWCKILGALNRVSLVPPQFYFEKIRVLKAVAYRLNSRAWNNGIGCRFYFVGFRKLT